MERAVVALEDSGRVESRNLARVVQTERRHRKCPRNGSAIFGLVRQTLGKGLPAESPGRQVADDVHTRNTTLEGPTHLCVPILELRRPSPAGSRSSGCLLRLPSSTGSSKPLATLD